jgi:thymidine kinase
MNTTPFLQIIMGPMFSGKSTELIRIIREYKFIEANILVVKHTLDCNRYSNSHLCTHDHQQEDCLSLLRLDELSSNEEFIKADIIFIEEAQFFEDLHSFVSNNLNTKSFVIAGLDGDFKRNPFGDILKLIPLADKVKKLNALCKFCKDGTEAPFTKRLVNSDEQHLVGGSDSYASVCRKHYLKHN